MKKLAAFAASAAYTLLPLSALAASSLDNPLGNTTLTGFLQTLLQLVVMIAVPVLVLFIVFIGFRFVAASGNAEELKKVRQLFFWALVGALIVLGAQALSLAIQGTVNQLKTGL